MALEPGTLYLVATPIGNLGDLSPRALETLAAADWIAAEDTRHTRRLLAHFGLATPLFSVHEHNEAARAAAIVERLARGERGALVVDAGTPGISDPGERVVRAVLDAGRRVIAVPGPSALVAALCVSGLPSATFTFAGFLPARAAARTARLAELLARPETVVLYEAPHRVRATLDTLAGLAPGRPVAACRELTKLHEEVLRGPAAELAQALPADKERGEWVLVVAGAPPAAGGGPAAGADADAAREEFVRRQLDSGASPEEAERRAAFVLGAKSRAGRPRRRT